ncbi:hypothetical protein EOM09_06130 [bacterium]|nr:hypothetical protein [bacterium]
MEEIIIKILVIILIFILSALPLHISVRILGGRTNILKSFLVTFGAGIVAAFFAAILPFGAIFALIILIWIYREMFRLKWFKAFIAWILQLLFIFLLGIILMIFGLSLWTISFF